MLLNELLTSIEYLSYSGENNVEITGIAFDSREVKPGNLFVCIKGYESDGHKYAKSAVEKVLRQLFLKMM